MIHEGGAMAFHFGQGCSQEHDDSYIGFIDISLLHSIPSEK